MKREIKFRAWDKTNKKMCDEKDFMMSLDGEVLDASTFPFTVRKDVLLLQFTRLLDKNKNPIYEGDIVRLPKTSRCDCGCAKYDKKTDTYILEVYYSVNSFIINNHGAIADVEIIGNIYENPDLTK